MQLIGLLHGLYFYSRPCGRGDILAQPRQWHPEISTHAPAGGATPGADHNYRVCEHFYSRPCGRGDSTTVIFLPVAAVFLLTPLREGRRRSLNSLSGFQGNFYSRPCGRGDSEENIKGLTSGISTHAPAGGATHPPPKTESVQIAHFYSRPCGRGDGSHTSP